MTVDLSAVATTMGLTLLATAVGVLALVALVRASGLRSLAKFAPHDFVSTVAMGSVLAATAARSVPLPTGVVATASIFLVQWLLSRWRLRSGDVVIDNAPLLLMVEDRVRWDAMGRAGVTVDDLRAKLREANVVRLDQIRAVVLEGTGDIAVLHSAGGDDPLDPVLLGGVDGAAGVDAPSWVRPDEPPDPFVHRPEDHPA